MNKLSIKKISVPILLSVILVVGIFALPSTANASSLTPAQVNAIIFLLEAFNVDQNTIDNVRVSLEGGTPDLDSSEDSSDTDSDAESLDTTNNEEENNEEEAIIEITFIKTTSTEDSATITWATNNPSESKLYLSGGDFSNKSFLSESGFASEHKVVINNLSPSTEYSYKITAENNDGFADESGTFTTEPALDLEVSIDKEESKQEKENYSRPTSMGQQNLWNASP